MLQALLKFISGSKENAFMPDDLQIQRLQNNIQDNMSDILSPLCETLLSKKHKQV